MTTVDVRQWWHSRSTLPNPEPTPDWQRLPLGMLAEHIIDVHHGYLWQEMEPLAARVDTVAKVHGEHHPELARVQSAYHSVTEDLKSHLAKEERILFPAIRALDAGVGTVTAGSQLDGPITQMMLEHDTAGALFEEIPELTGNYSVPQDGCVTYAAVMAGLKAMADDLHEHIHKENNWLFARTLQIGA